MRKAGRHLLAAAIALCANTAAAADIDLAIEHQGVSRRAILHVPAAANGKLPVIIYLHGRRPEGWTNHTLSQLDTVADRDGALAVYPEALGLAWNYAPGIREAQKVDDAEADDVGFIARLIDRVVSAHNADPARIYVQGDSRGGLMTLR